MKLTIITINLNNGSGLQKTITSVIGQTFKDFEYIVIDGGSTDGSIDVIARHEKAFCYAVSEPDRGIYHAMNKGIEKANADYVLFLNSGDLLLSPNTLERIAPYLGSPDIVYGNLRMVSNGVYREHYYPALLTFSYFLGHSLGHPAAFIKRALFQKVGLYDEQMKICADWGFFIRAIGLFHATYQHVPLTVAVFHTNGISSASSNRNAMREEQHRLLQTDFSFFETNYETYRDLKDNMDALRRSKPYRFLKLLGLPKYQT